jgi:protein prenyltransferase alpha subunit repeat containing protein 1
MSRALDIDAVPSLKHDPQSAYVDLAKALSLKTEDLLEIEILGKGHCLPEGCNLLVDDNSIGIPKVKLVQAFVVARQTLFRYLKECPPEKEDDLRSAAAVILLMDPEHLTAANTRKRLIQKYQSGPRVEVEAILKNELHFVDSYLTSRLYRHTKSPTLWGHRRWILETSKSIQMKHDIQKDLVSVVLVAAERHPRNYYAFSHIRWMIKAFNDTISFESTSHLAMNGHEKFVATVKNWCLRHPGDTSGFSFLVFCLSQTVSTDSRSISERATEWSTICKEVLKFAVSFKWTNESVWMFLRTVIASEGVAEGDVDDFYGAVTDILATDPDSKTAVKAAKDWCEKYR